MEELSTKLEVSKACLEESNKELAMRCCRLEEHNFNLQNDQILSFELATQLQSIIAQQKELLQDNDVIQEFDQVLKIE